MQEKAKKIAELLKLLANENRLLILCALIKEPMTVGKTAEFVPNITASALSQHLTLLKTAGILESDKQAQNVTYFIADDRVTEVIATLKKYYCDEVQI
ncbi:transcriptional regulator [Spirochaetia bacterium]|nr:transcriptional regulator [Spirochaetia bacterium]